MRILRIPFRLLFLLSVMLFGVVMATLFLRKTMSPTGVAASITRFWHQQVCNTFNIDITVHGQLPGEPVLLVANHISWFDISALGAVISARYLSKYEVVGWPVIGWLATRAGTLFIKRGASQSAVQSMQKMADALQHGDHVVLFPEGTTTDGTSIRKFHPRLFQSAIDANTPVQPVIIRYPHESGVHPKAPFVDNISLYESAIGMLGEPHMQVELHFLPALETENKSRDQLAKRCEALMRDKIIEIDSGRIKQEQQP